MDHPANSQHGLQQAPQSNPRPSRPGAATQNMVVFGLLWLFVLVVGLAAVVFIGQGVWLAYNGLRSASWPSAPGTITESRVSVSEPRKLFGRESSPMFGADIVYVFRVGSSQYTGEAVSFSIGSVNQSVAENQVQKYPLGKAVSVYYDPTDPTNSVLEPGSGEGTSITLFTGFMCLGGALLMRWAVARLKKESSYGKATAAPEKPAGPPLP